MKRRDFLRTLAAVPLVGLVVVKQTETWPVDYEKSERLYRECSRQVFPQQGGIYSWAQTGASVRQGQMVSWVGDKKVEPVEVKWVRMEY